LIIPSSTTMSEVAGKFIVVFKDSATPVGPLHCTQIVSPHMAILQDQINQYANDVDNNGGEVTNRYSLLKGFAAKLTEQQLTSFQSLQGDVIDHIEPDGVATIQ